MSRTGEQLLQDLSEAMGDWHSSTLTSSSSDGTTVVDTALQMFGEDELVDGWIRITQAGTNKYLERRVSDFLTSTATLAPAFPATPASGDTYQFHKFRPSDKFKALDKARILAYPQLAIIRLNEQLTGDGQNAELSIPSNMRRGPVEVWEEVPMSHTLGWNALNDPGLTAASARWTASGATASVFTRSDYDLIVPRQETTCIKLVGSGTYRQVVADMKITAALAAGRRLTFGMWVYQRGTTGTASVHLIHDGATATSTTHAGLGWELLTVTATVPSGNATLLTVGVTTGGSVTCFAERAYLLGGDRLPQRFPTLLTKRGLVRDDTTQTVRLNRVPRRGYQLRLVGRDPLTALGTTVSTQPTNSMEVDVYTAQLLVAKAARILLAERGWAVAKMDEVFPFIAEAEKLFAELADDWAYDLPHETKLDGWWSLGGGV